MLPSSVTNAESLTQTQNISQSAQTLSGVGGWKYLDANLREIHTTSVPHTLDQACDYFEIVEGWGFHPVFLQRREPGDGKYNLTDVWWDEKEGEVKPLESYLP